MSVFLDTAVVVAAHNKGDANHKQAVAMLEEVRDDIRCQALPLGALCSVDIGASRRLLDQVVRYEGLAKHPRFGAASIGLGREISPHAGHLDREAFFALEARFHEGTASSSCV